MQIASLGRTALSWLVQRKSLVGAVVLTSILGYILSLVSFASGSAEFGGISSSLLIPLLFGVLALTVYGISIGHGFWTGKSLHRSLVIVTMSVLLTLFFARISDTSFSYSLVSIKFTVLAFAVLLPLMFTAFYQIFANEGFSRAVKNILVFLFLLSLFSFLNSIRSISSTNSIFLNQTLEFLITRVPEFFWMIMTAFLLALINIGSLKVERVGRILVDVLLHTFAYVQMIVAVYVFSLSEFAAQHVQYWTMALISFVLWDTITRLVDFSLTAKNTSKEHVFNTVGYNVSILGFIIAVAYFVL